MKQISFVPVVMMLGCATILAQSAQRPVKSAVFMNAYSGSRGESELSPGPDALARGGLLDLLRRYGAGAVQVVEVRLTSEEDREYGAWNRMGLANGHLGHRVAESLGSGMFPVGLLANCNGLMGMLAGLQHSGPTRRPLRIGLVWIDAHADFNTPETTLSGMLGGMPVAVSAGLCLTRLRLQSGLDPALPFNYIVMAGVRDTDPLEQELLDRHRMERISAEELRQTGKNLRLQMDRLSELTDLIYVHIDMDVLDPGEVSGHSLTVAGGPTSSELAAALEVMFQYPKSAAIGIASYPAERDKDAISLKAAYALIEGALKGVQGRK